MAGADAAVYVWFLCPISVHKSRTFSVASAQAMTGSVFKPRFKLLLEQCIQLNVIKQLRIIAGRLEIISIMFSFCLILWIIEHVIEYVPALPRHQSGLQASAVLLLVLVFLIVLIFFFWLRILKRKKRKLLFTSFNLFNLCYWLLPHKSSHFFIQISLKGSSNEIFEACKGFLWTDLKLKADIFSCPSKCKNPGIYLPYR